MDNPTNRPIKRQTEEKDQFTGGAVRDTSAGKPRFDLISPFFMNRLAIHLMKGAQHYSARNWEKGIPSSRCYESLMRHLNQAFMGDTSEDHWSAAAFNLMAIIHNEEYNKEFHDIPIYNQKVSSWEEINQILNPKEPIFGEVKDTTGVDQPGPNFEDKEPELTVFHHQV